jgi:ribosomal protein S18 acetylase RimI-like enzyme
MARAPMPTVECALFHSSIPIDVSSAVQAIEAKVFDSQYCTSKTLLESCGRRVIVAQRQDTPQRTIVGYLLFSQTTLSVQVEKVAVSSECRRKGVGAALMAHLNSCAGSRVARLHVEKTNSAALALYANAGFTITKTQVDYYGTGEDAFVMENDFS